MEPQNLALLPLSSIPDGTSHPKLVYWTDPKGAVEDVIVRRLDRSSPGMAGLEICCHGGTAAVRRILRYGERIGLTLRRDCSVFSGTRTVDSLRAERAFYRATTPRMAAMLFDQANGAFDHCRDTIERKCAEWRSYPENERLKRRIRSILIRLWKLIPYGRTAMEPLEIVITGVPNVGKSTLLNRLAGYDRAIVSSTPGTTRDIVSELVILQGIPLRITDTAGLRDTDDTTERAGVRRAMEAAKRAGLILNVTAYGKKSSENLMTIVDRNLRTVNVVNQWDRASEEERLAMKAEEEVEGMGSVYPTSFSFCAKSRLRSSNDALADEPLQSQTHGGLVYVSAKTGEGIAELERMILRRLFPVVPRAGEAVPLWRGQRRWIRETLRQMSNR